MAAPCERIVKTGLAKLAKAAYKIDAGPKSHIQKGTRVCVRVCVYIYDQFAKVLKTVNSVLARLAHESMQS